MPEGNVSLDSVTGPIALECLEPCQQNKEMSL